MALRTAWGPRACYFTGALTRLFMLGCHPVAAYIIHGGRANLHAAATPNKKPMQIPGTGPLSRLVNGFSLLLLPPQAKREEALPIFAQPEVWPGSDGGGRPQHRDGLRREAAGGAALVRFREALLHQHAGARRADELLTLSPSPRTLFNGRLTASTFVLLLHKCMYVCLLLWAIRLNVLIHRLDQPASVMFLVDLNYSLWMNYSCILCLLLIEGSVLIYAR